MSLSTIWYHLRFFSGGFLNIGNSIFFVGILSTNIVEFWQRNKPSIVKGSLIIQPITKGRQGKISLTTVPRKKGRGRVTGRFCAKCCKLF